RSAFKLHYTVCKVLDRSSARIFRYAVYHHANYRLLEALLRIYRIYHSVCTAEIHRLAFLSSRIQGLAIRLHLHEFPGLEVVLYDAELPHVERDVFGYVVGGAIASYQH